ncbi:hypothetical protein CRYUN_Cryun20dG0095100 [Craigia yunnanensis]
MNLSSWFHRSVSRNSKNNKNPEQQQHIHSDQNQQNQEEELLGVTQQLIDHFRNLQVLHFRNLQEFPSPSETQTSSNVRKDLSDWQEQHAVLVLSKVKELSQLRFKICPRHLEEKIWRIYFLLVKIHVAEYELHAIQLAKLKRIAMTNEKTPDTSEYKVEMAERNQAASIAA